MKLKTIFIFLLAIATLLSFYFYFQYLKPSSSNNSTDSSISFLNGSWNITFTTKSKNSIPGPTYNMMLEEKNKTIKGNFLADFPYSKDKNKDIKGHAKDDLIILTLYVNNHPLIYVELDKKLQNNTLNGKFKYNTTGRGFIDDFLGSVVARKTSNKLIYDERYWDSKKNANISSNTLEDPSSLNCNNIPLANACSASEPLNCQAKEQIKECAPRNYGSCKLVAPLINQDGITPACGHLPNQAPLGCYRSSPLSVESCIPDQCPNPTKLETVCTPGSGGTHWAKCGEVCNNTQCCLEKETCCSNPTRCCPNGTHCCGTTCCPN